MAERYPNVGFATEESVTPSEFLLDSHIMQKGVTIASAARDSGNTVTTTLRPGLMLGKITASGKYTNYSNSASDGSQACLGILKDQVKVLDADANAVDAQAVMVIHGRVDESALIGSDSAAKSDLAGQIVFD